MIVEQPPHGLPPTGDDGVVEVPVQALDGTDALPVFKAGQELGIVQGGQGGIIPGYPGQVLHGPFVHGRGWGSGATPVGIGSVVVVVVGAVVVQVRRQLGRRRGPAGMCLCLLQWPMPMLLLLPLLFDPIPPVVHPPPALLPKPRGGLETEHVEPQHPPPDVEAHPGGRVDGDFL